MAKVVIIPEGHIHLWDNFKIRYFIRMCSLINKSIEMESITDNNYISGRLLTKQDRIQCICDHINRSNEELTRINEKLGAKDTPLEEWLRLSDIRGSLMVSIHQKEEELSRLTDSRRLNQPKRANYNY
jgi:hypothetical protein|uniref:Uncharacterized protein n=2 Tax=root TaxID=1 RepID=A0A8S5N0L2_9CAUD|nr:MAG TPA: hypothetical protein [Siphoviridae sp. ctYJD4]